jgi:hypothetical protein
LVGGISELLHPEFDTGIPAEHLNAEFILKFLKPELTKRRASHLPMMIADFNDYVGNSISGHLKIYNSFMP